MHIVPITNSSLASSFSTDSMVWIPGGTFLMGSEKHYPEESPVHEERVEGFWIDKYAISNEQFARFVDATGHVTSAERPPNPDDYPGAKPELLQPASRWFFSSQMAVLIFAITTTGGHTFWARTGAIPKDPRVRSKTARSTPSCTLHTRMSKRMQNGREKSYRPKRSGSLLPGSDLKARPTPGEKSSHPTAERWQTLGKGSFLGRTFFPMATNAQRLGQFPANGYGLFDMIGNVWEWTTDWYSPKHPQIKTCCGAVGPKGGDREQSYDPQTPGIRIPRRVIKGGSFLCAINYCRRYCPAARMAQPIDTSACHVGFRLLDRSARPPI